MTLPRTVARLVEHFAENEATFLDPSYNEALTRSEFINPLFEALGWDMSNRRLARPEERDVIHEDALRIEGGVKAPDYTFRLKGRRKFFVEAKKPSTNVATGRPAAYQVRRYGWSAGLPFNVVTDFQEFAVYDCRDIPLPSESAEVGRLKYFTYQEYGAQWDWLVEHFSRAEVSNGSLDRLSSTKGPTRTARAIDAAFLTEIQDWRDRLASDIARRNAMSATELNAQVQALIDRIVFLRIAEARGLEPHDQLLRIRGDGSNIYERLFGLFNRADDRYNSGLFHFRAERGRPHEPDLVAALLTVSDRVLNYVLGRLYYPEPYEFSVLPADILGHVYERFLGDVITLDPTSGKAVIEEKPEVRRAGGVYYTPEPIVEYIVETTLGPLLKNKTPKQVAELRVVDPACGSGSFLIAAYQYLLDWHTQYYLGGSRNDRRKLENDANGHPRLKTEERKRVLLNCIWGVDIDPSAVEVAKLSLLLKLIEGQQQLELDVGRLLPDLDNNIVQGNSIIGTDYAGEEDVCAFDWRATFPTIFQAGGFDAVIGNPPYFPVDATWGAGDPRTAYLRNHYPDVYTDKTDVLFYFLAQAAQLTRSEVGMIVSRSLLEAHKARLLRGYLSQEFRIREVLDFQHALVFPGVGINTAILRLTKARRVGEAIIRRFQLRALPPGTDAERLAADEAFERLTVPQRAFGGDGWNFADADLRAVLEMLDARGTPIGSILKIGQGMQTGRNTAFRIDAALIEGDPALRDYCRERARNSDIGAFDLRPSGEWLVYPEAVRKFQELPQTLRRHLEKHRGELEARAAFKRGNCEWWRYTWPLHKEFAARPKILVPYMAATNRFALDRQATRLGLTDTTVLYDGGQPEDLRYLLGCLNSAALTVRFRYIAKLRGGGVFEYFENTVSPLPIPRAEPGELLHDTIVDLVQRRIDLAEELRAAVVDADVEAIQEDIARLDGEIDNKVFEAFGLSDEEAAQLRAAFAGPVPLTADDAE